MKQEVLGNGSPSPSASPAARARAASRTANGSPPGTKPAPTATRRLVRVTKEEKETGEEGNRVRRHTHAHARRRPEAARGEPVEAAAAAAAAQVRLEASEAAARELQAEVAELRGQLQRLHAANAELEAHKRRLAQELLAAHDRIKHLEKSSGHGQQLQPSGLRGTRQSVATVISNLSEQLKGREAIRENGSSKPQPAIVGMKPPSPPPAPNAPARGGQPPPPPLPPSRLGPAKTSPVNKATALVELYNSLTKRDAKKAAVVGDTSVSPHHNSIVGELQNRSSHLLAIKADVETKGELISDLIKKVQTTAYTDVEDVLTFVDWLDRELSTLSDETAVLKHFSWPERKADALREAAFEYRDLKCVLTEASSFNDDGSTPTSCEATLRKISNLLDKLEKSMTRLINLRNSAMPSYKEFTIPTDWMLDSGIASKLKLASVKLAKAYMKRVLQELDTARSSERETGNEVLVAQSVRFAYRAHQFAGGLDSEAMRAFEELRERVRSQGSGSRVPLPGTTSP